ncbi:MAG TPA: four-helix bundle copper-binding protein [bacterium]|nr:four-helix bundle copper-binding protein [bacterium]
MNRRNALATLGLGTAMLSGIGALAAEPANPTATKAPAHPAPNDALAAAASACADKAEACLQHCLQMLGNGETAFAACAEAVQDAIASSRSLATLAAAGSKHMKAFAKVCIDVCKDCETECRKHAEKHPICKECADACVKMIQECGKA